MSKAFTRESDDSGEDEMPAVRPSLPPGTTNYITREGAERLEQRLKELLERKKRAGPSETAFRKLEANIRSVQQTLSSVVVAKPASDPAKVAFGATVCICDQNGEEESYRIVGIDEAEPERNSISWISPLARALLSRRVGDKVQFRAPAGMREMTILSIAF